MALNLRYMVVLCNKYNSFMTQQMPIIAAGLEVRATDILKSSFELPICAEASLDKFVVWLSPSEKT